MNPTGFFNFLLAAERRAVQQEVRQRQEVQQEVRQRQEVQQEVQQEVRHPGLHCHHYYRRPLAHHRGVLPACFFRELSRGF